MNLDEVKRGPREGSKAGADSGDLARVMSEVLQLESGTVRVREPLGQGVGSGGGGLHSSLRDLWY